jgi:hypothetical protein
MKSAARCAGLAAVTIARLSAVNTSSQLAMYAACSSGGSRVRSRSAQRNAGVPPRVLRSRSLRTRNVWCRSRAPGAIRMRSSASPRRRGWRSRCRRPGIHAWDRPLRQALTDDDHVVAVARVVVNEIATGNARHVQRGKESRRHAGLTARRASRQIPGASRGASPQTTDQDPTSLARRTRD